MASDALRDLGERIEALLQQLGAAGDPQARATAEELLRLVTDLYGAGLARVVALAEAHDPALVRALAADDVVGSLLLVHDLHPDDLATRVEAALASVRPLLAQHGGDVALTGVDADQARVRVTLLGSCHGCPSSASTLRHAVERAVLDAAPEIEAVAVDDPPAVEVAVTLGPRAVYEACPTELAQA